MQIIQSISALRTLLKTQQSVAFVPTMGNLHAGHLHLVEIAKQKASCVVVSIFVNPLQFGPHEDLANYPRTLEADCEKLQQLGADIVFTPSVTEMYPDFDGKHLNQTMTITPPPIADALCGAARLGHFAGVATVVMKLFNIVQPNCAIFGKKDFQQLFIIRELVRQFNMPITIIAGETMREASGLAMSSRNGYLSGADRSEAPRLNKVLKLVVDAVQKAGESISAEQFKTFEQQTADYLTQLGWVVDYISIRSASSLLPAKPADTALIVLGAAKLGSTRLIDNIEFTRSS
jgi:pantoate--beta-alanine ligase